MKTKPKTRLLANGDYSTTANCRKEILAIFRGTIVIFSVLTQQLFISLFLADPVTMFSETVGSRRTLFSEHRSIRRYQGKRSLQWATSNNFQASRRFLWAKLIRDSLYTNLTTSH